MRRKRRDLDPDWIIAASERIQNAVIGLPEFQSSTAVGCYLALPFEVQIRKIMNECRAGGKDVYAPAFNEKTGRYELSLVEPEGELKSGRWNISEPDSSKRAGFGDLDLLIVPALAYDREGGRLGHGGGHYDHILGVWSGFKIGVAFEFQVFDSVPMGSQDIPVDVVVTEHYIYRGNGDAQPLDFEVKKKQ